MSIPSKKIPIVFLIDAFTKGSGTENQLEIIINNLDSDRFAPYLVILRNVNDEEISDIKCPVISLGVGSLISLKTVFSLWNFVRFLKKNYINIMQIFFQDSNIFGVIAGRLAGIRKIIISRRDMGWWYGSKYLKYANFINKFSSHCLVNAEAVKEVVVQHETFNRDQVSVIYNGIPEKEIQSGIISRKDFNIPDDSNLIGIVANLKPIKQIDLFLEMASLLKNDKNHFIIIGQGILEQELRNQAAQLGLMSNLHFYHTTDHTNEVIRLFDVGVLTSQSEGLSNVLIEYAINKVPAVAFDVGGNGEIIIDGKSGFLIKPYDVENLKDKVESILEGKSNTINFDLETQKLINEKFSVKQLMHQTEQYYNGILNEH